MMMPGAMSPVSQFIRGVVAGYPDRIQRGGGSVVVSSAGKVTITPASGQAVVMTEPLGIGGEPDANFQLMCQDEGIISNIRNKTASDTATDGSGFNSQRCRGTLAAPEAVESGDRVATWSFSGYTGAGFSNGARVICATTENWSSTARGMRIIYETTSNGTTALVERFTINQDGSVAVAAAAKTYVDGVLATGDTYHHQVSSNVYEIVAGGEGYRATTTFFGPSEDDNKDCGGASNRWNDVYATNATIQTSDAGDKKDVRPLPEGLDLLRALRPVAFKFLGGRRDHWGFVAQDVAAALRERSLDAGLLINPAVNARTAEEAAAPLGLRYIELLAPTVRAVQELDERMGRLERVRRPWLARLLDKFRGSPAPIEA
jgi:hypothetical protein